MAATDTDADVTGPVVVIDVDSLRPDHLGAYGTERGETPRIDAFATEATVFERAYAANSPCMPARAGFHTGRYGVHNGVETHRWQGQQLRWPPARPGRTPPGERAAHRTLPECFFDARRGAVAVSSFPRHPAPWFYHVWDAFVQPREPDASGDYFQTPRAEAVVDRAIEALDRHDPDYLYVQLWDPHTPYSRPADEVDRFADAPLPPHPTAEAIRDHRTWDAWRGARDAGIDDRGDLRDLLAAYDAEVAYADAHVGRLLDALRERDRYDRSCVVLLADHGEEFGEHGLYSEHWSTHEGTQRVPLVVKPPADAPRRDRTDALVTNVDAAATVLAYAGLDAPDAWQGTSLRDHVAGGPAPTDALVVDHGLYTAQRAVRTDRWKLIRTYEAGLWDAVVPGTQLFDLDADPWETTDVAADNPDVVADLAATREAWVDAHVGPGGDALADAVANGLGGAEIYGDGYDGV